MSMAPLIILCFLAASSSYSVNIAMAQSITSCAQSLAPCFMNITSPTASCCAVLKETIKNDLPCLCKLYNTTSFFSILGVNQADAIALSDRCQIFGGSCSNVTTSAFQPTPATPKNNGHFLGGVSWISTCTMFLFWVSFMLQ